MCFGECETACVIVYKNGKVESTLQNFFGAHPFSSADIWCVNDDWEDIDQANRPGFLAYHLFRGGELPFTVRTYDTASIQRILISTDGLSKLFRHDQDGGRVIDEFFSHDEFFEHPTALPKYLTYLKGLRDDIAIVMGKKIN